ncbi:MAG: peptidylprolyl isomerase [Pseudomonadota bacterium]
MKRCISLLCATAITAALALPATAQDEDAAPLTADSVMAVVNGTEITLGHMLIARATLPQQFQQLPDEVLFPGILDQLVQQTILAQSFDGTLPSRVQKQLENETRSLTAGEVMEDVLQAAVTEEAVQAIYDADYATAEPEEEYNASHILVETEADALAVKAELDGGAEFAQVAMEKSTGPSGPGGGSLGWFGTGAMVPDFEAAVIALEVGEVSGPVQTQFGWHVITLNEVREKAPPTVDEVRDEIEGQIRNAAVEAHIAQLTEGADIDRSGSEGIDAAAIGQIELIE